MSLENLSKPALEALLASHFEATRHLEERLKSAEERLRSAEERLIATFPLIERDADIGETKKSWTSGPQLPFSPTDLRRRSSAPSPANHPHLSAAFLGCRLPRPLGSGQRGVWVLPLRRRGRVAALFLIASDGAERKKTNMNDYEGALTRLAARVHKDTFSKTTLMGAGERETRSSIPWIITLMLNFLY
ncbi:hypothetical protein B0H13DRAFT_1901532 [Mycena leptocephala]|nr:hypothetical protein B0H13DRAFT_1901532 [Mycena leptocephala]